MKTYFGVRLAALAVLGFVAISSSAQAATISLLPAAQNINVAGNAAVDVWVTLAQGEVVGGANLDLTFDDVILDGFSATNDPDVIMDSTACPSDPGFCDFSGGFGAGVYNLNILADLALTEAALAAAQNGLFRLATLVFTGMVPGVALLDFVNVQLSDFAGDELLVTSATGGSITVNAPEEPAPIPEPGTIALFGAGAAVLLARRLRRA